MVESFINLIVHIKIAVISLLHLVALPASGEALASLFL